MPSSVGPNTKGEENLVFGYDTGNFPYGWGLSQLVPNSEFTLPTPRFAAAVAFTNVNYLGALFTGSMTGDSFIFSGGDSANLSVSNPGLWGWNRGSIGSTAGNWMSSNVFPNSADTSRDFIVDCKWRFAYIAAKGSGSLNPTFQIGRSYSTLYQQSYTNVGSTLNWNYARFKVNGADGGSFNTAVQLVLGLTSADSAVEVDYIRFYEINKTSGLLDLKNTSAINVSNVSFAASGQVTFDGTDDGIDLQNIYSGSTENNLTVECVVRLTNTQTAKIFAANYTQVSSPTGFALGISDSSSNKAKWFTGNLGTTNTLTSTTTFNNGQYYYVVGTYDGSTKNLYINGVQEATASIAGGINNLSTVASIGYLSYLSNQRFTGDLPVVKIYNRALTASEVQSNYNAIKGRFNIG